MGLTCNLSDKIMGNDFKIDFRKLGCDNAIWIKTESGQDPVAGLSSDRMSTQVSVTVEGFHELLNSYMFQAEERLFNTEDGGNKFLQNLRTSCTTMWLLHIFTKHCFQNSNIHVLSVFQLGIV